MADLGYPTLTTKHRNGVTSTMTNPDSSSPAPADPLVRLEEDAAAREVAVHLDEAWRRRFMVKRDNRDFVLYAGLLDLGHQKGLQEISTTIVQIPSELNAMTAIVHATVVTEQGTFQGLGDASPGNVSRMMVPHLIRMAETRAKARALRDATNVGVTAFEELGEAPDRQEERERDRESVAAAHEPAWRTPSGSSAAPRRVPTRSAEPPLAGEATPEQRAAITRLLTELGQPPDEGLPHLSAADAGRRIMELQEQLRQARAGGKA